MFLLTIKREHESAFSPVTLLSQLRLQHVSVCSSRLCHAWQTSYAYGIKWFGRLVYTWHCIRKIASFKVWHMKRHGPSQYACQPACFSLLYPADFVCQTWHTTAQAHHSIDNYRIITFTLWSHYLINFFMKEPTRYISNGQNGFLPKLLKSMQKRFTLTKTSFLKANRKHFSFIWLFKASVFAGLIVFEPLKMFGREIKSDWTH